MKEVKYYIYNPGGNKTVLVIGNHYNVNEKKIINDKILNIHKDVEQVGFINEMNYELVMAGGEFCGNATRCAVKYYLKSEINNEIVIRVSGMSEELNAGSDEIGNIYVNIPVKSVENKNEFKIVRLEGITHIVVDEKESKKYLEKIEDIKQNAKSLIDKLNIDDLAVGVMFTQVKRNILKIYPHCIC